VLRALGELFLKFYSCKYGGGVSENFSWLKKPPMLPFAAFHHPLWDYGIVFALQAGTAVATGGGRSFYSYTILATALLEEESSLLCLPGWIFRRQAMASAKALFGP
jgi:hypothetical protein